MQNRPSPPTYITLILALPVVVGVVVRMAFPDSFEYSIWSDRDLLRAWRLDEVFQVRGAEINGAYYGRVPGGAYYYMLALLQQIGAQPWQIYLMLSGLVTAGIYAVYAAARNMIGVGAALFAAGAYALSPGLLTAAHQIWNPLVSLPLSAASFPLLFMVMRGKSWVLPGLAALLGVAVQVHLSNLALLAGIILVLTVIPNAARLRHWLSALVALLAVFAPYIIDEIRNGFFNTGLILFGYGQKFYSAPNFDLLGQTLLTLAGAGSLNQPSMGDRALTAGAMVLLIGMAVRVFRALGRSKPEFHLLRWRKNIGDAPFVERAVLGLGLIIAVGSIILLLNRNSTVLVRYSLFLIPPLALLAAAFVAEAMEHLRTCNTVRMIATAALFVAIFIPHGLKYGAAAMTATDPTTQMSALISGLRQHTALDDGALRSRLLLLGDTGRPRWRQMGYLHDINTDAPGQGDFNGCTAAVDGATEQQAETVLANFLGSKPLRTSPPGVLFDTPGRFVFGYGSENGNCYASTSNPYDRTAEEKTAQRACAVASADGVVARTVGTDGNLAGFVVRHTFAPTRLCLGIDFVVSDGALRARLYSHDLRGYHGYTIGDYNITRAALTFVGTDGRRHTAPLVGFPVGGQDNPVTLPYTASATPPPDGDYGLGLDVRLKPHQGTRTAVEEFSVEISDMHQVR